ncbi:MAG: glycosyltransferase [Bacteroidetes bacterium]|nr:glycosyltransferase [Bacteroidota bacterium]MBS1649251.1 glycosyltransferase [Bacteroidota bacterium]
MKPTILIVYQYFYPGYNAGGPVQSLINMIETLHQQFNFAVFTSAYDLNETIPYENIHKNEWNKIRINNIEIAVWYATTNVNKKRLFSIVQQIQPQYIYINGMYGKTFFLTPLLLKKQLQKIGIKLIVSPRGMLQKGALAVKPFKKKIYFKALKLFNITNNIFWHATNFGEVEDIKKMFGRRCNIVIAANIPKKPLVDIKPIIKEENVLSLVYLSIITPKKNLLLLVEILKECKTRILLDIYGPIKEKQYWNLCNDSMKQLPANILVNYKGNIQPKYVQQTFTEYNASILLTQGENFGHALFESLSVGTPIITSNYTNWNKLEENNAGWNVDINNKKLITTLIETLAKSNNKTWQSYTQCAHQYATNYFYKQNFADAYNQLFS